MGRVSYRLMFTSLFMGVVLHACSPEAPVPTQTEIPYGSQVLIESAIAATPTTTPAAIIINITQRDFHAALKKWRALKVLEYEITILDSSRMDMGGNLM